MYCAYVTELKGLRKHSNADKLMCVEVFGNNVIVDLSYKEGQRVVYFPSDGQLSEEFANDNSLVRRKDENGNNIGGYLDPNKRNITALKLRGEKSDGLVLPIEVLSRYTDISKLKLGEQITILNGHEICKKYIPKRNRRNSTNRAKKVNKKELKESSSFPYFLQHVDTAQLAYNMNTFKEGDTCYITRKLHGTSARTSNSLEIKKKKRNLILKKVFKLKDKEYRSFKPVTGTRRVVLKDYEGGYYGSNVFRQKWHDFFKDKLPTGFCVFYEIVGWVDENRTIMPSCDNKKIKDKEFTKKFGKETVFSYGCEPGTNDIYVYRITATVDDGTVVELPWEAVKVWCDIWGVKHVPELEKFLFTTPEDLKERVAKYNDNMPADEIGKTHVAEGVVVRIDNRKEFTAFKEKSWEFKVLENIVKDTADAPDMEEEQELEDEAV